MTIVTTKAEQSRAGRVARRLGGYSELIRLAGERQTLGDGHFQVRKNPATGIYTVVRDQKRR